MAVSDGSNTPLQDGRFLLVETLGRGAMGTVYRAFDGSTQRLVALKTSHEAGPAGPAHPLAAEYEIASRVRHPCLVRALELVHAKSGPFPPDTPYLVLEHADGLAADRAFAGGRVSVERLSHLATRLLLALDHLHGLGFVHRDVKPSNVLVGHPARARPEVRLIDFGLAVPLGTVREPGRLSGSLPFLAPESLLGLRVDARTDLYSLGLLLFQLAAGCGPLADLDPVAWVRWHLNGSPVELAAHRPDLPTGFVELVRELTRRDPAARPASAQEALNRLGSRAGASPPSHPLASGLDRARLRLAIDAARLGAVRLLRLPADGARAADLLRELEISARVRGLDFHELPSGRSALARLVVHLASARGSAGLESLRRHGLDAWLPFAWVGGVPLADPWRSSPQHGGGADAERQLISFLLDSGRHRPLVLSTAHAHATSGLAARVAGGLRHLASLPPRFLPGSGGVLLVERSRVRATTARLVGTG